MEGRLPEETTTLALFFYGTLKRGQVNHDRFCRGFVSAEEATVRGRLYDLPFGFPALVVTEPEDVRAVGTDDPSRDAAAQRRLAQLHDPRPAGGPRVYGELFVFDRFKERLAALDRFEGFDPLGEPGLYRRVLVPVETTDKIVLAWVYSARKPFGVHLPGGRWPE